MTEQEYKILLESLSINAVDEVSHYITHKDIDEVEIDSGIRYPGGRYFTPLTVNENCVLITKQLKEYYPKYHELYWEYVKDIERL